MAAKKTAKTAEKTFDPVKLMRQAWLANLGGYAKAYEDAKERIENARGQFTSFQEKAKELTTKREELVKELVGKGEEIETKAEESFKEAKSNVVEFAKPRIEKIRSLIPTAEKKADKVGELEAEIEKLNKKIAALTKKPAPAAKKPAAKKPVAKKAAPKAAPKKAAPAAPKKAPVVAKTETVEAKPAAA